MKKLRWPILIVIAALAAVAALLYSQQPVLPPILLEEEIKPASGGEYTEALVGSLSRLNPVLDLNNPVDHDVDRLLYSGLVRFDDRGLAQGDLAESWGISLEGNVYNFSIRPDAVWHDGKPVTSDDVAFTVELMKDEDSLVPPDIRDLWDTVEVNVLDEKLVQFNLPEPFAPFLDYLTFGVLPKHLLEGLSFTELIDSPFNLNPVGSGPYRFDRLIVEEGQIAGISLTTFEDYYGEPPFIEHLHFRYYPDASSALAAYRAGEIMGINRIPAEILPEALQQPGLMLYTGRLPELSMVFLNLDNAEVPFFQDPAVRRAMLLGLNRQGMIDNLLGGQGILADGPIFPNTWAYYDGIERVSYDPEAALSLLKEAGYTIPAEGGSVRVNEEGARLEFELLYPDDARYEAFAQAMQKDWARLGIQADLVPLSYEELVLDHLDVRNYQAALIDLNLARSPDPDPYPFWHQTQATGGQNYAKWDDFQASEYLEQARVMADLEERTRSYRNFQVRFSQELPALPLFYPVYTYAVDEEVRGVSMGPLFDTSDRFSTVTQWYLNTRQALPGEAAAASPTQTPAAPAGTESN